MKKQITALFFQTEFDLSQYLGAVIGVEPSTDLSVESQGKFFQFRNIEIEAQDIYGRLCQIRVKGKPDQSTPDSSEEKEIPGGVIEAAGFRYHKKNNVLLVQQNHHVSTSPKSIFIKVLNLINENKVRPERGFSIRELHREDVLKKLLENKADVRKIQLSVSDADMFQILAGNRNYLKCCFDQKAAVENIAVTVTLALESKDKEKIIEDIVECENEEKGTAFHVKGQSPLVIGEYIRKELMHYEISEDASSEERYRAIYNALAKIDVSDI